jgi:hypothetical protein
MRRDIAWRHLLNEKGLKYAVVGPGYDFLTQLFIYGCACLNIADLRWRNGHVVIVFGCLLLSVSGYLMWTAFHHAIMTYLVLHASR